MLWEPLKYDPYLPPAVAQEICDLPKYLESAIIRAFTGENAVEAHFPVGSFENHEIFLFVRWVPDGDELTAALSAGRRQVRRLDTDNHKGKQPHIHHFDGTRLMHGDVRSVPVDWDSGGDFAKLLRDFAGSVNLFISEIVFLLDNQVQFQSDL